MDSYIDYLCLKLGEVATGVPDALRVYKHGRYCFLNDDLSGAKKAEVLNYLLHNSVIPSEADLADDVIFGYGGVGVILHNKSVIGRGVMIGSNVTVGGGGARGTFWLDEKSNKCYAPKIKDYVNISTGAKILGGIVVGEFSIVGANSVVRTNVPPLSVVAGVPSRVVNQITIDNCLNYKSNYYALRDVENDQFIDMIRAYI